jgi:hypothetical protein
MGEDSKPEPKPCLTMRVSVSRQESSATFNGPFPYQEHLEDKTIDSGFDPNGPAGPTWWRIVEREGRQFYLSVIRNNGGKVLATEDGLHVCRPGEYLQLENDLQGLQESHEVELPEDFNGLALNVCNADWFFENKPCSGELGQFFERVKKMATEQFLMVGEVSPAFFLLSKQDDEFRVCIIEAPSWGVPGNKTRDIKLIRQMIDDDAPAGAVLAYCFASESWASVSGHQNPSQDPDRGEVLTVYAETRDGLSMGATAEIKRHALSPKAGLGEWSETIYVAVNNWNLFGRSSVLQ